MRVAESHRWCRELARERAKNFYHAFRLLDPARRDALCSVYAFMRHCDDLSDEPGAAAEALEQWRQRLDAALDGAADDHPMWPAFVETTRRYAIPRQYYHEMIDGVSSDLTRTSMASFEELYRYCYQVSSIAGLSLIHIFGCTTSDGLLLAEKCGIAFQLTNILRDIAEDRDRGRVYLPREEMARFGVAEIAPTPQFRELMLFQAGRARAYYNESRPLLDMVHRSCRPSLWALVEIYSRLLERIERAGFDVFTRRIRVPAFEKLWIAARALPPALLSRWTSN